MDTHQLQRSIRQLEQRLRPLLPAQLYADIWVQPSANNLLRIFHHLRTLLYILGDHVPPPVKQDPPIPGEMRFTWLEGSLLFTDLAGFTPFMEAHVAAGQAGAERLLELLNHYFATMTAIISKSGGELLEFTGDAILAQFVGTNGDDDTAQRAMRAGLRMQRAMEEFQQVTTPGGIFDLTMRVGIHWGRFLTADLGTPVRMERVLLGRAVQEAKQTEGSGQGGRVCLSAALVKHLQQQSRSGSEGNDGLDLEPWHDGYYLLADHLSSEALGEYEITLRRRNSNPILFDRSAKALITEIKSLLNQVEPLASYQSLPILKLLVEHAADRQVPPLFPKITVMFVSLLGFLDTVDQVTSQEEEEVLSQFNHLFSLINAMVQAQGGVLQRLTYHPGGSDLLIYFGTPNAHSDDPYRAAAIAAEIRDLLGQWPPLSLQQGEISLACQIGIAHGQVFAAEMGEARGRREYNILGDTVNTAARLMSKAQPQQILLTQQAREAIATCQSRDQSTTFQTQTLGHIPLKGKAHPVPVYTLIPDPDCA